MTVLWACLSASVCLGVSRGAGPNQTSVPIQWTDSKTLLARVGGTVLFLFAGMGGPRGILSGPGQLSQLRCNKWGWVEITNGIQRFYPDYSISGTLLLDWRVRGKWNSEGILGFHLKLSALLVKCAHVELTSRSISAALFLNHNVINLSVDM